MMPLDWARRLAARLAGLPQRPGGSRGAGYDWERLAERRLARDGYRILERNFRARSGEIDFVAEENGVLCFIEVKGRSGEGFGLPAEAVTEEKRRRIFRAAEEYLQKRRGEGRACRFDVVSILEKPGEEPRVKILRDAFEGPVEQRRK
jgi:putative endonuclease